MEKPNLGVVVKLKSGGPEMTIISLENNMAHCQWFGTHDGQYHYSNVPCVCLEAVNKQAP